MVTRAAFTPYKVKGMLQINDEFVMASCWGLVAVQDSINWEIGHFGMDLLIISVDSKPNSPREREKNI